MERESAHSRYQPPAENTYVRMFSELDQISERLHEWVDLGDIPDDRTALGNVKLAFIVRAFNQFRAIVNLLKTNHWKDGLILTRSLFELLLNVEELMQRQKDKEEAAQRFLLFSQLQDFLELLALERYMVVSGRRAPDYAKELDKRERDPRKIFPQFAFVDKKKKPQWRTHWVGRNVAEMANLSPDPMRKHQYQTLYANASIFTHSGPPSVLSAWASHQGDFDWEKFENEMHAKEDRGLRNVASYAVVFLAGILRLTGDRLPKFRIEWLLDTVLPLGKRIAMGSFVAQRTKQS